MKQWLLFLTFCFMFLNTSALVINTLIPAQQNRDCHNGGLTNRWRYVIPGFNLGCEFGAWMYAEVK